MDVSGELMENHLRRQLYRVRHGKHRDQSLQACGRLLSDIRADKCVSRSVLPLTVLICPFGAACHARTPVAPHHQALSDFCSDPNTFILNTTQFNTGTSSGTASTGPNRGSNSSRVTFEFVAPDLMSFFLLSCFGLADVLDYYLTCSRRMSSPFQQVTLSSPRPLL